MLFEIKPVALKAMVMAVVVDVALRSVRSVPADSVDALSIDEKDAAIGCAFAVGRLIGDVGIVPNGPIEEEVEVPIASSNPRYAAATKSRWVDFLASNSPGHPSYSRTRTTTADSLHVQLRKQFGVSDKVGVNEN